MVWYKYIMAKDPFAAFREWGKEGAKITNAKLTKEKRSKAAKKAWRKRKQNVVNS